MGPGFESSVEEVIRPTFIISDCKSRFSVRLQLAFGVGHVLNDICSSIWFSYLLIYLNLVLEFDSWQAGFLLLVGQVNKEIHRFGQYIQLMIISSRLLML